MWNVSSNLSQGSRIRTEFCGSTKNKVNIIWHAFSGAEKGLSSKAESEDFDWFLKNVSWAQFWLKDTHSVLSQVNDFILKAKKIAIQMMDKASRCEARKQAAREVGKLIAQILEIGNNQADACPFSPKADPPLVDTVNPCGQNMKKNILALNQIMTPSFREEQGGLIYQRDTEKFELRIEPNLNMRINLVGSNFLTKPLKTLGEDFDLEPGIDQNTRLSDLNRGSGVNLGSIRVIDGNAGISWDINLLHTTTVGEVINRINSWGIAGLSAEISTSKRGLELTRIGLKKFNPERAFTISEAGGTTARDLGILDNLLKHSAGQLGSLAGRDLDPILTRNTPISLLKSGQGLSLGKIRLALGKTQVIIDLSYASTVGEIIHALNNSMRGVIASVNHSQKGISIESTVAGQSLLVFDGDDKKSASGLGISGSPDIWGGLLFLREAINNGDSEATLKSLEILDLGLEEILSHQAETEAKLKRLENIGSRIIGFQSDATRLLSEVRRKDLFQATTDLADQQSVYESALQSGVAMIQPTLLDFIR